MRRLSITALAVLLLGGLVPPASPATKTFQLHLKRHHTPGAPVFIVLQNVTDDAQRLDTPWTIRHTKTHEVVAQFHWTRDELRLAPGETAVWEWDQRSGPHRTEPSPPDEGERVGPGGYQVTIGTSTGDVKRRFHIGRFFTLGFEGRDAEFVVFVNERKPIDLMKAEAAATDKTLIVSGKVRGQRRYNGDWSFSMGPGSIVLGEVFIEVCDGSPGYVERHRKEWLGKRWCPWSSYVASIGR
jgi:hypothetical protein